MKKCFVAVSGGVDSATSLLLLKEKGYAVEGVTMIPFGRELVPDFSGGELESAKSLCESMSIPHHAVDLRDEFSKRVVADFVDAYANGETPNPCIVCNRFLKFGALADYAFSHGADEYATGHYVRVKQCGDRRIITRAADPDKDQSYMLWSLKSEQISRFIAPLGEMTKKEVREQAQNFGLAVANKGDSQDICFIPDGDYRAFLERIVGKTDKVGDFVHKDGTILGKHLGQRCYTLGQRKGLGIAYKEPLYVIGRDMKKNQVILGSNSDLFTTSFCVRNASFSALDFPSSSIKCQTRIRYRAPFVDSVLTPIGEGRLLVETESPVRAVTPGQSAVFYDGETLLGGGIIEA
ncbi:MAG: tRNA 2-thiouridine(34) synthase MnmA [Clostridia bacterium]|nr:tRNA 2-thiouridine(34) synthase MnmA [Clostridia bacterium]